MKTKRMKNGCEKAAGSDGKTITSKNTARELPPLCYSVDEVCKITGLGRTTIYAAFKSGALIKANPISRRTVVLHEDLMAFLRNSRNPEDSKGIKNATT
jgi:hypothetical protein